MPLTLPVNSLIYFKDTGAGAKDGFLSEHNRSELNVTEEIIENRKRTVNGTMRSYVVAQKTSFQVSWDGLPATYQHTLDGYKGGWDILDFYRSYYDKEFYVFLYSRDLAARGTLESAVISAGDRYTMRFSDFSYDIAKRNVRMERGVSVITDLWNVSLSLEEV
jgi:hypothetical protein